MFRVARIFTFCLSVLVMLSAAFDGASRWPRWYRPAIFAWSAWVLVFVYFTHREGKRRKARELVK